MEDPGNFDRPCALLLAGGEGQRFGQDKRQIPINKGSKLLQESVRCFLRQDLDVVVCLANRDRDGLIADDLTVLGARIFFCDRAALGMGATLAQGISACGSYPGVFVGLGDMPAITGLTLALLERELHAQQIVFPRYQGRRGHPVLFGKSFFPALGKLEGDRGAAELISTVPESCVAVDVEDPGIHMDVDTNEDLRKVREFLQRRSSSGVSG